MVRIKLNNDSLPIPSGPSCHPVILSKALADSLRPDARGQSITGRDLISGSVSSAQSVDTSPIFSAPSAISAVNFFFRSAVNPCPLEHPEQRGF